MPAPQYIEGDTNAVRLTVATAKAVAKGDIIGMQSGTLVRAEDETWNTDLNTTQAAFVPRFAGVSQQAKAANVARAFGNSQDNVVMAAIGGVYEFDCASATFEVGDLVGPAKAAGNALLSQTVVGVATEARAIGRVVERGTSVTRVKVRLLPVLTPQARQS
jgi:hypothetical protein